WYILIPVFGGALFLLSTSYPAYYILTAVGFLTSIVAVFITAFSYNRTLLKTIMGAQLGLLICYFILILLITLFPSLGAVEDESSKLHVTPVILSFNVFFFSGIGFLLSLITALYFSFLIFLFYFTRQFRISL